VTFKESVASLRDVWEETGFQLEMRQCNADCVAQERDGLSDRTSPNYRANFLIGPLAVSPTEGKSLMAMFCYAIST